MTLLFGESFPRSISTLVATEVGYDFISSLKQDAVFMHPNSLELELS